MTIQWILTLAVSAGAAITDALSGRIPNRIPLVAAGLALGIAGVSGAFALSTSLVGGGVCLAAPLLLYCWSSDAIGGGDVKLLATIGMLLGPTAGLEAQLMGFVLGSLCALVKLAVRGELKLACSNAAALVSARFRSTEQCHSADSKLFTPVRMGPAIFAGCVIEACRSSGVF